MNMLNEIILKSKFGMNWHSWIREVNSTKFNLINWIKNWKTQGIGWIMMESGYSVRIILA